MLADVKVLSYLCSAFEGKQGFRALSSAGSERLPYKQRVGGSNPSAPTNKAKSRGFALLFSYCQIPPPMVVSESCAKLWHER